VLAVNLGWATHVFLALPLMAFAGALAATLAVYVLAHAGGRPTLHGLLLTGLAVAALGGAGTSLLLAATEEFRVRTILFWLAGGLEGRSWTHLWLAGALILTGTALLAALARPLDLLSLGEDEAAALGLSVHAVRLSILTLAALIAGAVTSNGRGNGANGDGEPPPTKYADQMTIRVRRRMFSLDISDISWIQGASQYSRVHTKNGEYLLSRTLASLECELDPRRFFRIHRSAIVNAAHVREVRSSGDGRYNIYLHGGQALPMGRARREILEKLLSGIGAKDN